MKQRILALDIGEVRVGVAISDQLLMLAHPYKTIHWKNRNDFIHQLKKIIQSEMVGHLVVGIPYTMRGTHSRQTDKVLELFDVLSQELDIPIIKMDERLTTMLAHRQLQAGGKKASRNRDIIDQVAAVNILQSYLDKLRISASQKDDTL